MLKTTLHLAFLSLFVLAGCAPSDTADATHSGTDHHDDHGHDDHGHDEHGHDEHGHDEHGHDEHGHDEHEHHDADSEQPKTLSDAIDKIQAMGSTIVDAFKKKSANDAHDELHDIGHVIESLSSLAKNEDVPSDGQTKIEEISEQLMESFGKLDDVLHGGEMPDVDTLSTQIDENLATLKKLTQAKP